MTVSDAFQASLKRVLAAKATVMRDDATELPDEGQVSLVFEGGAVLHADFWRLILNDRQSVSSFDHNQRYGLPEPVDAVAELSKALHDKLVEDARLDAVTGDLYFEFAGNIRLQILNFTAYEVWTMTFPDGTVEYSNYNR